MKIILAIAVVALSAATAQSAETFKLSSDEMERCVRNVHIARYIGAFSSDEAPNESYISAKDVEAFTKWALFVDDGQFTHRCVATLHKLTN